METIEQKQEAKTFFGEKKKSILLSIKGLTVAFLTLLLLIPTLFISNLIRERLDRQEAVRQEVYSKWASEQTLTGPILVIPYMESDLENLDQKEKYKRKLLYFMPETLDIQGEIFPHQRHRSIFDVTVYQAGLNMKGTFSPIDIASLGISADQLLLNESCIFLEISDFRGVEEQLKIHWDDRDLSLGNEAVSSGLSDHVLGSPVKITYEDLQQIHNFSMNIKIKGAENLMFAPIGKTTSTHLTSSWTNPSFIGNFLPNNPAEVTDSGFVADWKILHLNRPFPQVWKGNTYNLKSASYGVKLLNSTDSYAKTERSIKYAILFIALTFALYFFIEVLNNKKIHLIQYALVGMALCVFYTLLLSISEYLNFNLAYLIASLATIALISFYTQSAFGSWKTAALFTTVLSGLYGFIFILIQLQDGALLFGSIGLFVLLAIIMYYSRKIDWYGQWSKN